MSSRCRPPRGLGGKKSGQCEEQSSLITRSVNADEALVLRGWRAAGETGSGELQHHRNMKAPTSWRGFLLGGAGLLDGGRQWVSEGAGVCVGGGGCRVQAKQHSQRNVWNSERKSYILLRGRCSAVATATGINSPAFISFCCFLFSNRVVFYYFITVLCVLFMLKDNWSLNALKTGQITVLAI